VIFKIRGGFPNEVAALKLLFLALRQAAKKWAMPIHHWREALNHFAILWPERMPALERVPLHCWQAECAPLFCVFGGCSFDFCFSGHCRSQRRPLNGKNRENAFFVWKINLIGCLAAGTDNRPRAWFFRVLRT
jgi:hypothetical protein